jgi:hypothetical protein
MGDGSDASGAEGTTLEIRHDGALETSAAVQKRLADRAGNYRLLASGDRGDLLVLMRERPRDKTTRGIHFLGTIDGSEALMSALHFFAMGQESGALCIESDAAVRTLYLHRGKLLSARSSRPQDRLGQILVMQRLVSREQVDECFRDGADSDLLGRALLRRGLLNNHQVYEALRRQTQEIFAGAMMVERGVYYLIKPLDMNEVPAMLHLDLQELLFEGLRRTDELKHLRTRLPSDDVVLAATGAASPSELGADAAQLRSRLDGKLTLAELAEELALDELSAVKAAVELLERKLAAEAPAEEPAPSDAESAARQRALALIAPYERAMEVVLAAVCPDGGRRRRELVRLFLHSTESFATILRPEDVGDDGSLDTGALIERAAAREGEGLELLRRCLHELLFFLLFEVGQRGDEELLGRLHREVANILSPRKRAPLAVGAGA